MFWFDASTERILLRLGLIAVAAIGAALMLVGYVFGKVF